MKLLTLMVFAILLASCGKETRNQAKLDSLQESDGRLSLIASYKKMNFDRCPYYGGDNSSKVIVNDKELRIGSDSVSGVQSFLDAVSTSEYSDYQDDCYDYYNFKVSGSIGEEALYVMPNPELQTVEVIQITDYEEV